MQGVSNRLKERLKTREGKIVVVLLVVCLALVAWNVAAIGWMASNDGGVQRTVTSSWTGSDGAQPVQAKKATDEMTQISYESNCGDGAVEVQKVPVNKVRALSSGDGFSREGYTLMGWSLSAGDDNKVDFKLGDAVIVDKENEEDNVLYAVWAKTA